MAKHSFNIFVNIFALYLGILLSASFFHSTALASPIAETSALEPHNLFKRYSGTPSGPDSKFNDGGDTSDYPSDSDITSVFIAPSGAFVFFSNIGDSQAPFNYATNELKNGAVILRGAYPKGYVTRGKNPKRSGKWFQDFLDRISGVYADKAVAAGKRVYFVGVMDTSGNPVVADCSIWNRIELPTLAAAGIPITFVDYSNFANTKDYPVAEPFGIAPIKSRSLVEKRASVACFDWEGDREDPADPDSDPTVGIGYYPGQCGVHLQQYQKNEGTSASNDGAGTHDYRFTIALKDAEGEQIGYVAYYDAPGGQGVDVDSQLPLVFIATAGTADSDDISFAYGSQSWKSSDGQCKVGGYDSGSRQMDCGFSC